VEKYGALSLTGFLSEAPFASALLAQSFWAVLAIVPMKQGRSWSLVLPPLGFEWFVAALVGLLSLAVHTMWYKSMTGTTPAINTLLWNLDILAALVLEALVTFRFPSGAATLGGCITLLGTIVALQSSGGRNTWWGCLLCFSATTLFSAIAIFTSRLMDPKCRVVTLMAMEGVLSLVALGVWRALSAATAYPSAETSLFLGLSQLMLNLGWLSVAASLGAPQAAMAACLSMPLSLLLDATMLHSSATTVQLAGSFLVILGFCVGHRSEPKDPNEALEAGQS
ncbi:unnamed protein product, partial [Effrenium voratum]